MTLSRSFIRNAPTTPLDARLILMGLVAANADGSPRTGVLGPNPSLVSTTGTMNLAVAAGEFVTSKGRGDGVAIFANDGTVNVPVSAAPGSNSRIDILYVKHNDDTTGDANALPIFGVAAGAAAASPVKPAIPTGATELAQLRIYAGTTATNGGANVLTNTAQMTAARGGVVPFRAKAELDAWTTAASGQVATDLATGIAYTRSAGAWRTERPFAPVEASTAGAGTVTSSGTMGALSSISCSAIVNSSVATRAKISLMFKFSANAVGCGATMGVSASGATTITPSATGVENVAVLQQAINQTNTYSGSWFVDLNAGATTLSVVGQITGVGGTRAIATIGLLVEPIAG